MLCEHRPAYGCDRVLIQQLTGSLTPSPLQRLHGSLAASDMQGLVRLGSMIMFADSGSKSIRQLLAEDPHRGHLQHRRRLERYSGIPWALQVPQDALHALISFRALQRNVSHESLTIYLSWKELCSQLSLDSTFVRMCKIIVQRRTLRTPLWTSPSSELSWALGVACYTTRDASMRL